MRFEAEIGAALPDLRPLVGRTVRQPQQRLNTAYFDSADGRLRNFGLSLRHRTAEGDPPGVWTLSMPTASDDALERFERSWPGTRGTVPPEAEAILRGVLRREPVHQLVELETRRQRLLLHDDDDDVVAELDDDLVAVTGGPHDGRRFRQVDLALQARRPWNSRPVMTCLRRAGLRPGSTPTWARATRLPSPPSDGLRLSRSSTLADVLRAQVRDGYRRLVDHDWRLRDAFPDVREEDVHQARVATRRLRSNLKTFGDVLDPVWLGHVRDDLKWVGDALGEVRDADVLRSGMPGLPDDFHLALVDQRAAGVHGLRAVLDSDRYLQLLDRLHAASISLPLAGSDAVDRAQRKARDLLPALVRARWRAARRAARKARAESSPESLHRVRIKAKQLRYAAEAATPVIGSPARRLAAAAESVQTELGEHHDAVVAEAWLREQTERDRVLPPAACALFEGGMLAADARMRRAHYEEHWLRSWRKLAQRKRRRWLR